jgi:hypothetical protein
MKGNELFCPIYRTYRARRICSMAKGACAD